MNETKDQIKQLFDRIPRRHTPDNVKEMYSLLDSYEDLLKNIEGDARFEDSSIVLRFDIGDLWGHGQGAHGGYGAVVPDFELRRDKVRLRGDHLGGIGAVS